MNLRSLHLTKVYLGLRDHFEVITVFFNPHQRCGYSDSPFARKYFFYTAGSRNGLEGVGGRGSPFKMGQFEAKITKISV